jgi:tetratricopeptide (TPR) repeat protein
MALSRIIYCGLIWTLSLVLFPNLRAQDDILVQARALATNKQRKQALELLESHLGEHPNDGDARLLYGLVLSWEGRYDGARQALQMVLDAYPRYTDAALALINVELWSGNPERADEIASRFLEVQPNRTDLMLAQARALEALKRPKDAMQVLNDAHRIDPENREAIDMRRALRLEDRAWRTSFNFNTIAFNDHSSPWREEALSLQRGTSAGSLTFRFSRGSRFGYHSNLAEADWYPHIARGTYAYLNAGYSPEGILYPTYRAGAELFHNFGHGYEGSAGLRRLVFSSTRINVYTASLGRYHSDWYSVVRTFVTPGTSAMASGTLGSATAVDRRRLRFAA